MRSPFLATAAERRWPAPDARASQRQGVVLANCAAPLSHKAVAADCRISRQINKWGVCMNAIITLVWVLAAVVVVFAGVAAYNGTRSTKRKKAKAAKVADHSARSFPV